MERSLMKLTCINYQQQAILAKTPVPPEQRLCDRFLHGEKVQLATRQFKRPMYYQLKKERKALGLCWKHAGGLNADANASVVRIIRTESEKQVQRDVNANAIFKIATGRL